MLDLIITYLNFFIIAIKYIVKIIAFQPPEPKGYRIKYFKNEAEENNNRLELKSGDIIEILFALPNKSQNLKKTNDKSNEIKNEDKNKEIIIKRKQKYEYKPATNIYSSYELKYILSVIYHEYAHFYVSGHSDRFYNLLESVFIDYKKTQANLRKTKYLDLY